MSTAVLVPVLARPHRVAPLVEAFTAATPEPHRLVLIVDPGDRDELAAIRDAGVDHIDTGNTGGVTSYARKVNLAWRALAGDGHDSIFLAADDVVPHPGWLTACRALLPAAAVVGTDDGGVNPRVAAGTHSTHSLVAAAYLEAHTGTIDRSGEVLHPYGHCFVDDELVETAQARGVFAFCPDAVVEHRHPFAGTADDDATYRRGRQLTAADRRLFHTRRRLWRRGNHRIEWPPPSS